MSRMTSDLTRDIGRTRIEQRCGQFENTLELSLTLYMSRLVRRIMRLMPTSSE
jgi:hypothetical protein